MCLCLLLRFVRVCLIYVGLLLNGVCVTPPPTFQGKQGPGATSHQPPAVGKQAPPNTGQLTQPTRGNPCTPSFGTGAGGFLSTERLNSGFLHVFLVFVVLFAVCSGLSIL